jgi:hypothetical protein
MSKFGWSLPPGVSHRMIDEAMGVDEPCAVCCKSIDDCVCPECPECHQMGDRSCYIVREGHKVRLELTREQVIARQEARMSQLDQVMHTEAQYLDYLREGGNFSGDIADNPDPFG